MKALVGLLVVSLALLVVACDSGPTEAEIQQTIDEAVAAAKWEMQEKIAEAIPMVETQLLCIKR